MTHTLTFNWRNESCEERIERSQQELFSSCLMNNIKPILCIDYELPKFADILRTARKWASQDGWMAYTSSDCVLVNDPWKTVSRRAVHGFRRTEKPSNELGIGVDMYLIPVEIWDQYLSRDIPDLYIGVTHMDWWLPRACQKIGMYNQIDGLLTHESHPKISGEDHPKALHNLTAYNAWADRNGISKV